jgi:D-glycero-alpha-D-manno-heptose-7-phosphate kinase
MLMHYTGVAHFSGTNNWEIYKRQIEKKKKVDKGLARISAISVEWSVRSTAATSKRGRRAAQRGKRKALVDGITTPEVDAAIAAATGAVRGRKGAAPEAAAASCFSFRPDRREAVTAALATVPGRVSTSRRWRTDSRSSASAMRTPRRSRAASRAS